MKKRKELIPLFWPYMDKNIRKAVDAQLQTRWLGQGPKVDEFEKEFGEKFGYKYCVAVNSGTSALELAYHLLGLKKGDEVIVPVLTCSATNVPLARRGVKIVFADIDPDTLNVDWEDVRKKVTKKTKAVVPVNLGGYDAFIQTYGAYGPGKSRIKIITDSAQMLDSTKGNMIVYSFQAIKSMTTGDGGMLVLDNEKDYKRAKKLRWFGIDREARQKNGYQMYKGREMTMDIDEPGYKYQMTDIAATMGIEGLKAYDKIQKHRRSLYQAYVKEFDKLPQIYAVGSQMYQSTPWLMTILVEDRDRFAAYLKEWNIETNLVQIRNDIYKVFGGKKQRLPGMNLIDNKYISLPLNARVTLKDVEYICRVIRNFYDN